MAADTSIAVTYDVQALVWGVVFELRRQRGPGVTLNDAVAQLLADRATLKQIEADQMEAGA